MPKAKFVQCSTKVDKSAVTRKVINGIEHIIVSSYTLPDDIVMNGGLYPADEIESSYRTLERTLAPVEHPVDDNGMFISASDPIAIHNFHAGAFNVNVTRKDGRVHVEKHINVQEALKTERGKRLLDRINELETSEKPRPIHTSVGVWLEVEPLGEMRTNTVGQEYDWIARNMTFDHDAILLDSVGAAQPHQGVGMAVNAEGDQVQVEQIELTVEPEDKPEQQPMSASTLNEQLTEDIKRTTAADYVYIIDIVGDTVIFETSGGMFQVPYKIDTNANLARIVGLPIRVDKVVTYTPKVNKTNPKGDAMKEMILNALAEAGVQTKDLDDAQLLAEYAKLQANQSKGDDNGANSDDIAKVVANAVKSAVEPVANELASLKTKMNEQVEAEKANLVNVVVNSKKFPGIDEVAAKLLPVETLKSMAASCVSAYGLPLNTNSEEAPEGAAPSAMPK